MPNDKPYLDENGDLIIPFACPDNDYKYWKPEGRKMKDLMLELDAPDEVLLRYLPRLPETAQADEPEATDSQNMPDMPDMPDTGVAEESADTADTAETENMAIEEGTEA